MFLISPQSTEPLLLIHNHSQAPPSVSKAHATVNSTRRSWQCLRWIVELGRRQKSGEPTRRKRSLGSGRGIEGDAQVEHRLEKRQLFEEKDIEGGGVGKVGV